VVSPLTTPEVAFTEATLGLLLLHAPPGIASLNVVVPPTQSVVIPVIALGNGLTVTDKVTMLPDNGVNVMVVTPAEMAVSTPVLNPMVATAALLLDHVPATLSV
jgi:hypothetical protein